MAPDSQRHKTWQEIAEAASKEKDPQKLLKLLEQLDEAFEERDRELRKHPQPQPRTGTNV